MITIAQRLLGPTNSVPTNTQATNSLTVREFFVDIPTQTSGLLEQIIPMYLYQQYADDSDLQAFVSTFNTLAQGYLSWFTDFYQATPLGVYTSANISGALLDWTATGIYNLPRPIIPVASSAQGEWDSIDWNTIAWGGLGSQLIGVSDDIYKRFLTWHLYRGDGFQMSAQWVKRRIARFIYGINGSDFDIGFLQYVNLSISAGRISATIPNTEPGQYLKALLQNNLMVVPFQVSISVNLS